MGRSLFDTQRYTFMNVWQVISSLIKQIVVSYLPAIICHLNDIQIFPPVSIALQTAARG